MNHPLQTVAVQDPEVYAAIYGELQRQEEGLELIASENFVSDAVLAAAGSVLTNKYAEGFPGRRYYGGCAWVDQVEVLACSRACRLFGAEYANVQPHAGSQANMAVYLQVLKPGDVLMAMDLNAGGHLTHGSSVNFSGRLYRSVAYGVRADNGLIDYDAVADQARRERPKLLVAGASAYARQIDFARFAAIAQEVGAHLLVDMAHIAGLVAAGLHPSPIPHADFVTTTTHKTLRGPRGGLILAPARYAKLLDSAIFPRLQGGPLMHVIAAKAVAFAEALRPEFVGYQRQVLANARALAEQLQARGYSLVSGGTDNHLLLLDLRPQQLTGKLAEAALEQAAITVNKNMIPFDPEKPMVTSGIRLGTPALTTRGMDVACMRQVARLIDLALSRPEDSDHLARVRGEVQELAAAYPLYRSHLAALPVPAA